MWWSLVSGAFHNKYGVCDVVEVVLFICCVWCVWLEWCFEIKDRHRLDAHQALLVRCVYKRFRFDGRPRLPVCVTDNEITQRNEKGCGRA